MLLHPQEYHNPHQLSLLPTMLDPDLQGHFTIEQLYVSFIPRERERERVGQHNRTGAREGHSPTSPQLIRKQPAIVGRAQPACLHTSYKHFPSSPSHTPIYPTNPWYCLRCGTQNWPLYHPRPKLMGRQWTLTDSFNNPDRYFVALKSPRNTCNIINIE